MLSDFIPSKSTPPSPRISPSLAYSELWDSLIVFGGNDLLNRYHDIWNYSLGLELWANIEPITSAIPSNK